MQYANAQTGETITPATGSAMYYIAMRRPDLWQPVELPADSEDEPSLLPADYDNMAVEDVMKALETADSDTVQAIAAHEAANKGRVTITRATEALMSE